jgi:hypothetical protein
MAAFPVPIPIPSTGLGVLQGLLTGYQLKGMIGYVTLMILTVFPITGLTGLNLVAVGQPLNAFLKVTSIGASLIIMTFLSPYLPIFIQGSYLNLLAAVGPWYMFDVIQMLHYAEFNANGFEPIIPIPYLPSGGGKGSAWMLNITFLNILFATIAASGQVLAFALPTFTIGGVSLASIGNLVSIGGASLLGASFLGSVVASSFAPALGTAKPLMGGGLPPLSSFVDKLNSEQQQQGGGKSDKSFLMILGLVTLIGLTLGFARSKQA